MDQESGGLEKDLTVKHPAGWWGLRPWKRHSTILVVVGFLFVLVGVQYIVTDSTVNRDKALAAVLVVAPIQFWAGVFIFAGLLAMLSSKWPPRFETWGYMVLTGLSAGWAATYLTGWLFFGASVASIGQVIIWASLAFMWWAISGFPNPERSDGR